jgi:hypothetical protein
MYLQMLDVEGDNIVIVSAMAVSFFTAEMRIGQNGLNPSLVPANKIAL